MSKRKHTVDEVLKSLSKKNDIRIVGNTIQVIKSQIEKDGQLIDNPKHKGDLGNGSWGKIDYLRSQGYVQFYVAEFN